MDKHLAKLISVFVKAGAFAVGAAVFIVAAIGIWVLVARAVAWMAAA